MQVFFPFPPFFFLSHFCKFENLAIFFNIFSIILKLYPKKNSATNCPPPLPLKENTDYLSNKYNFPHLYSVLKRLIYPKFLMEKGSGKQF